MGLLIGAACQQGRQAEETIANPGFLSGHATLKQATVPRKAQFLT